VTASRTNWVVGVDLGQEHDYSAVVAIEYPDRGQRIYRVRHAQRFPLGTRYSEVVDRIHAPLTLPPLLGRTMLAIDATGLGAPIVEQVKDKIPSTRCHPIVITPGDTVSYAEGRIRVPKRDLVSTTAVLLQNGRLRIAEGLDATTELVDELLDYRQKISDAGHDSYGPSSSTGHDDLIIALSLACWTAEKRGPGKPLITARPNQHPISPLSTATQRGIRGHDPWDDRGY
jgi:hypothetical protein